MDITHLTIEFEGGMIGQISDSYKILAAILFSVSVMFVVGVTLVLKITNSSLMYR